MEIQGCHSKINVAMKIDNDCTIITFANLSDMMDFCGHQVYLLGEELFNQVGWQHLTAETCYSYKFKTHDFKKYIQKTC